MTNRLLIIAALWLAVLGPAASALAQGPPSPTGIVSGHVILADTHGPGRNLKVTLVSAPTQERIERALNAPQTDDPAAAKALGDAASNSIQTSSYVQARTDMDGAFTMGSVPPGDYVLYAEAQGYVSAAYKARAAAAPGQDMRNALAAFPRISVAAGRTSTANRYRLAQCTAKVRAMHHNRGNELAPKPLHLS